jgi:hypothetical protein
MAPKKTIGLRVSDDLLQRIEAVQGDRSLSETVITLIERGLGIEPPLTIEQLLERLEALEKKVTEQDTRLIKVEQSTPMVRPQPIRSQPIHTPQPKSESRSL